MVNLDYTPERGDIILIDFNPQRGREQAGYRPAFIVSSFAYNQMASLALMCPITRAIKGLTFEVLLPEIMQTKGVILVDHVKSLDWKTRKAKFIEKSSQNTLEEVLAKLEPLVT